MDDALRQQHEQRLLVMDALCAAQDRRAEVMEAVASSQDADEATARCLEE